MGNYHYIYSGYTDYITVLDTDRLELRILNINQIKSLGDLGIFNTNDLKYNGDNVDLTSSIGTIVFEDSEFDSYWVLFPYKRGKKIINNELAVKVVPKKQIVCRTDICNSQLHNVEDIRKKFKDPYNIGKKTIFSRYTFSFKGAPGGTVSYSNYLKLMGLGTSESDSIEDKAEQTTETENTVEQETEAHQEQLEDIIRREELLNKKIKQLQTQADSLQELDIQLKARENAIAETESRLQAERKEVEQLKDKLRETLLNVDSINAYKVAEVVMDVKNIFEFKETPLVPRERSIVFPNYTYELILKSLSVGDVVNIPKDYLITLSCTRLRFLETKPKNKGYSSLEQIKFIEQSKESLIAIVEYSNTTEDARIHICRDFGVNDIQADDIIYYTSTYERRKRLLIDMEEQ